MSAILLGHYWDPHYALMLGRHSIAGVASMYMSPGKVHADTLRAPLSRAGLCLSLEVEGGSFGTLLESLVGFPGLTAVVSRPAITSLS